MGAELLVAAGMTATAAATVAAVAQGAILVYGLYSGYRQRKAAKNAAAASLADRTIQVPTTDMSRDIVYGERVVTGRWAYAVEPRDEPGLVDLGAGELMRPANPYLYVVLALAVDHEIESIEDILFDGQTAGPFDGGPPFLDGVPYSVGLDSKYHAWSGGTATYTGTVPSSGYISTGRAVTKVLTAQIGYTAPTGNDDPGSPGYFADPPSLLISLGDIIFPPEMIGQSVNITYTYEVREPKVTVWCYRGRVQDGRSAYPVNAEVQAASGGEWNETCGLAGIPHVVVRIKPDMDMFAGGVPDISVRIKGKKCLSPQDPDSPFYSRNAAVHVYDYLRTVWEVQQDEINGPLIAAAESRCDEWVFYGYKWDAAGQQIPQYEQMYRQDIVLSTEATLLDNLRTMLASMAGTCVYAGGQFDIRAGAAPEIAGVTLDDSDLAGPITCQPELGLLESYNCVRGRHVARNESTESETPPGWDFPKRRVRVDYVTTDFPPYKSPTYIAEDGAEVWQEIDLPGVVSPHQAQRVAILQLRVARNSLSFEAEYKPVVAQLSAGQVVNITVESFGWLNKPFFLMSRERRENGNILCRWTEAALPIFEPNWSELTNPDPAPNTRLTPATDVPAITGLTIESGSDPQFYEVGSDGQIRAYAVATWDPASPGVLYGGRIEAQYKYGEKYNWESAPLLAGDATSFRVRVSRGQQVAIRVRPMNAAQIYGPWVSEGHHAVDAPENALGGNLLTNAEFRASNQIVAPDDAYYDPTYIVDWSNVYWGSPEGTVWTPFDHPPGFNPVDGPVANGSGGFDDRYTGIAMFGDREWTYSLIRFVESRPIGVTPGRRMLCYVDAYAMNGIAFIGAKFYRLDGTWQTQHLKYANWSVTGGPNPTTDLSNYERLVSYFEVVPDATHVSLILGHYRQVPEVNGYALAYFHRPYLGYAAPGQILIPPWSK